VRNRHVLLVQGNSKRQGGGTFLTGVMFDDAEPLTLGRPPTLDPEHTQERRTRLGRRDAPLSAGALPGNLHAVRNPWITDWRRRARRPQDRWVRALVKDLPELLVDRPGPSYAEPRMMKLAAAARVCRALPIQLRRQQRQVMSRLNKEGDGASGDSNGFWGGEVSAPSLGRRLACHQRVISCGPGQKSSQKSRLDLVSSDP
jgi:hypothetical protein